MYLVTWRGNDYVKRMCTAIIKLKKKSHLLPEDRINNDSNEDRQYRDCTSDYRYKGQCFMVVRTLQENYGSVKHRRL